MEKIRRQFERNVFGASVYAAQASPAGQGVGCSLESRPLLPTRSKAPEMIGLLVAASWRFRPGGVVGHPFCAYTPHASRSLKSTTTASAAPALTSWRDQGPVVAGRHQTKRRLRSLLLSGSRSRPTTVVGRARIGLDSDCPQFLILPVGRAPEVLLHPPGLSLFMHVFYRI
jgi:hypothetical protein